MTEDETLRRRIEELERELVEAQSNLSEERAASRALEAGQVDAIVDRSGGGALLLQAAQAALQASEELYRTIVTTADEGIWTADARMVTTFANERAASMLGYTVGEMVGRPADDFLDPSSREEARLGFERRRQGIRERRDMALRRKDGTILWASVTASPLVDRRGAFAGSLVMGTDITERRRLEEARLSGEERFSMVFHASPIPIGISTVEGDILEVNDRFAEFFGYTRGELVGGNARSLGLWADPEDREHLFDALRREGRVRDFEATFRRKSGEPRDVLLSVESITLREVPEPVRIFMFTDVTENRRAAELLRESEERYRVLFDGSPLPMLLFDQETFAIAAVNAAALRHYGYSREEFLSRTMREIWHPDQIAGAVVRVAMHHSAPFSGVLRHVKNGGAGITVDVFAHPVLLAGRRYQLSAVRDITDQREMEERLRQSQKMEAVGQLAGGVAHDFNNLLTVMFGYSDVLLQGLEPGPLHEAAQEVRRSGDRAAALTRQLLAFSRKQTLVPEILDVGDVVNGLSTLVERLIGENITVSIVVAPNLWRVKADRGQLEQVVMNLAVNARDAMPEGGKLVFELQNVELDEVYAATHAEVHPGPFVLMAISDTGSGMDTETQKRIFEPFFTTKEAGKGTGLGLSTVHGIVLQSGGSVSVYSEPGRGTTFKIYLPRLTGATGVTRPVSGIRRALPTGSETVLVVEDEAAIRQLTKLILEKAGYTVLLAESPVAAERIAGSHTGPIHLMLTDIVMPGMKGPELAERLTRLRPDLRVLFMSGYTDNAIVHHGILETGTAFLQKPFTPLRLTQKIREVLGRADGSLRLT